METRWLGKAGPETEAPQPGASLYSWVYLSPGKDSPFSFLTIRPCTGRSDPPISEPLLDQALLPTPAALSEDERGTGCTRCPWVQRPQLLGLTNEAPGLGSAGPQDLGPVKAPRGLWLPLPLSWGGEPRPGCWAEPSQRSGISAHLPEDASP